MAIVGGITSASGELTYYTNVVQLAPHDRIAEYTAAQSLLLGVRGTLAPFAASALLGVLEPRAVLLIGLAFMVTGAFILSGVVREPLRVAPAEPVAAPPPPPPPPPQPEPEPEPEAARISMEDVVSELERRYQGRQADPSAEKRQGGKRRRPAK